MNKNTNRISKTQTKNRKIIKSKTETVIVKETSVNILSTNARNMKYKEEDLKNKVRVFKSSIFAIHETHYKRKGKFKMHDFIVFESIRKNKEHGGTMLDFNQY